MKKRSLKLFRGVQQMNKSLKRISILTIRNLKEIIREPLSLIFIFALPLVMEIMFYFLFHEATSQFEMIYLAPGIVVFSQAFLTLFSGMLISTDRNTSFLTRLFVSKAKSYEFIFAYALAVLPIAILQSILFFLVGGIIDSSLFTVYMLVAIPISVFTSLFFIAMGILIGSICNERAIGGVASIIISGQSLLSGMWFPLDKISDGMIIFMKTLPFRNATLIVQNSLLNVDIDWTNFGLPFLIASIYTIVAFVLAISVYQHKMKEK